MLLIVLGKFVAENLEPVADDGVVQGPLGNDRGVELHARIAKRKIDGGLAHARQVLEGALVAIGASRAVHAADVETGDARLLRGTPASRVEIAVTMLAFVGNDGDLGVGRHHSHAAVERVVARLIGREADERRTAGGEDFLNAQAR